MAQAEVSLNSKGNVAIDKSYHWIPVGKDTPIGVKLQLIDRAAGVAHYGIYKPGSGYTHWAKLPTFDPADDTGLSQEQKVRA